MTGAPLFSLSTEAIDRTLFGGRHVHCRRSDLEHVLLGRVCDDATVRCGVSLATVRPSGSRVAAVLSDASVGTFEFIVGAGGVHSITRREWFRGGVACERYLGFDTASFSTHDASLRRRLGDEVRSFSGPGRQATVCATDGDHVTVGLMHGRARPLVDPSPADIIGELRAQYGAFGDVMPDLLAGAGAAADLQYAAAIQVVLPRWSVGRLVLVGDACQCVSPLGSMGPSLAMAGARVLAMELVAADGDVGRAFFAYERRMRPAVARAQEAGRRMARWIAPRSKLRMLARDIAIRASVWPIGAQVMRRAIGVHA